MLIHLLKSKIHRAQVTGASVDYEGSLTIAEDLMELVGLRQYERILCSNLANGNRFETYAIRGERGSGAIVLNGSTAHLGKAGERLVIMAFHRSRGSAGGRVEAAHDCLRREERCHQTGRPDPVNRTPAKVFPPLRRNLRTQTFSTTCLSLLLKLPATWAGRLPATGPLR
jgi:aspartate 1-decarboxylase